MRFFEGDTPIDIEPRHLVVAGWTGRDEAAVAHHIEELAAIGVAPPSKTPLYYRVSPTLLTMADEIAVVGETSSGEVEPLVVEMGGRRWLGLGSDHTDRGLETHSVALSKQICPKPCAAQLWAWESIADRLEEIELESWIEEGGERVLYQQGKLASIRPLDELVEGCRLGELGRDGAAVMFGGTFGAKGGVRPAAGFSMAMTDPATGRRIEHGYRITNLPEIS